MTFFQRGLAAALCLLVGLVFWPLLVVGGVIAWSVYVDIREEPERKREEAAHLERMNRPISIAAMRGSCESPAEVAFFDAMVAFHGMTAGPGCVAGEGIQLRTQVGLGELRNNFNHIWRQYRGDFLIDDKLVVEIDGAAWHGSEEAVARDAARDERIRVEGFTILRIPASVVFNTPAEAVRRVEEARRSMTASG